MEIKTKTKTVNLNKPGYSIFLALGIFFLVRRDLSQASIFWALALVFDPFNIQQPFLQRPLYQKIWLVVHLAISFTIFILLLKHK